MSHFLIGVFVVTYLTGATLSDATCDKLGILLYEDLGCVPNVRGSSCASSYTCQGLEPPTPQTKSCIFRGRNYENSEKINETLTDAVCSAPCSCEVPSFTCATLDCPEWLGHFPPFGCYMKFELGGCCSIGHICPPFENLATCEFEGHSYKEGQTFYPMNSCLKCVCQKGFKGIAEEPFCQRQACGIQVRRNGVDVQNACAAVYKANADDVLCCPDDFLCPDGSEIIQGDVKSEDTCKFGDKLVKVGQKFEKLNWVDHYGAKYDKLECKCVIPPLLRCVKV